MKRDEYLEAQGKKNFTDAVKNDFLCKVYKYLKISMQKIFLEMFFYQTVWHLISLKPVLAKKEESDYFGGLKNYIDAVENLFLRFWKCYFVILWPNFFQMNNQSFSQTGLNGRVFVHKLTGCGF